MLRFFMFILHSCEIMQSQIFLYAAIRNTTETKSYQQEIPNYLQFSERCKIYIF